MKAKYLACILLTLVLITRCVQAEQAEIIKITPSFINQLAPLPVEAVEELKKYENFDLATGKKTVSINKDDEVGYGVTSNEVEDAIKEGFLPKDAKLPKKMTKAKADWWMTHVTIPTYRSIVRKTVTTQLTLHEEASLVFFAQNAGRGNLRRLVAQENRLNDGNKASVVAIMPLYYKKNEKLCSRCEFQLAVFQEKSFEPKV